METMITKAEASNPTVTVIGVVAIVIFVFVLASFNFYNLGANAACGRMLRTLAAAKQVDALAIAKAAGDCP